MFVSVLLLPHCLPTLPISLIIDFFPTFNGYEDLSERLGVNDKMHKLDGEPPALTQDSLANDFDVGKGGEEKKHRQAVVEIGERVLRLCERGGHW